MARHVVARVDDIPDGARLLITVQGRSVGIFNIDGRFFALRNRCPHQGAELCQGSVVADVTATAPGEIRYDRSRRMIQCPWHGWEYDLRTGQSYFGSRVRPYGLEIARGDALGRDRAVTKSAEDQGAILASGRTSRELEPGPYQAEMFPLSVENDYLVIEMPADPRRGGAMPTGSL
jgi:nitrite reductase/ring-hydroxylating ferredoxin subunit